MIRNILTALVFVILSVSSTTGFQGITSNRTNGSQLVECSGRDISLNWDYNDTNNEVIDVEWFYIPKGESAEIMIAIFSKPSDPNTFMQFPVFDLPLRHDPSAGITLLNASHLYSGMYYVLVNTPTGEYRHYISVDIHAPPTTNGSVIITTRDVEFNRNTGQKHLVLSCGTLLFLGNPPASATWRAPDMKEYNSTYYLNGNFYFDVPNPVQKGSYECVIQQTSVCQNFTTNATSFILTDHESRLSLLEDRVKTLESNDNSAGTVPSNEEFETMTNLTNQVSNLSHKVNDLTGRQTTLEAGFAAVDGQLLSLKSLCLNATDTSDSIVNEIHDLKRADRNLLDRVRVLEGNVTDLSIRSDLPQTGDSVTDECCANISKQLQAVEAYTSSAIENLSVQYSTEMGMLVTNVTQTSQYMHDQLDTLRRQGQNVSSEIDSLKNDLSHVASTNSDLMQKVQSIQDQLLQLTSISPTSVNDAQLSTISNIYGMLSNMTSQLSSLQIDLDGQRTQNENLAASMNLVSLQVLDLHREHSALENKFDDLDSRVKNMSSQSADLALKVFDNMFSAFQLQTKVEQQEELIENLQLQMQELMSNNSSAFCLRDTTRKPTSCVDVKEYDVFSGQHTVFLPGTQPFRVYCDQSVEGGGWTIFQRRRDGSENFTRTWVEYENGFGDLTGEFWLGLRNIFALTSRTPCELRVDMTMTDGTKLFAQYSEFRVGDPASMYSLHIAGYHGTAGDSLISTTDPANGQRFSTFDRDNSNQCAMRMGGGWWYGNCGLANLNGAYTSITRDDGSWYWPSPMLLETSLKAVEMKTRCA